MLLRLVGCLSVTALAVCGSELAAPGLNKIPRAEFQSLVQKGLELKTQDGRLLELVLEDRQQCSIPLAEARVAHPERFVMPRIKSPETKFDSISRPASAPACKGWNE